MCQVPSQVQILPCEGCEFTLKAIGRPYSGVQSSNGGMSIGAVVRSGSEVALWIPSVSDFTRVEFASLDRSLVLELFTLLFGRKSDGARHDCDVIIRVQERVQVR